MPNPVYTFIKYIWYGLVWFYDILTTESNLMANPVYTYIRYIWFGLVGFMAYQTL